MWPTEMERLGYVSYPRSLKEGPETSRPVATVAVSLLSGRVTGSASQRKHKLMRCTCCLLYSRCFQCSISWMWITACQCPLARLVTLEVERSLWRDPNFVCHPTWRLHSLLQGTRVTYVTKTFHGIHNRGLHLSSRTPYCVSYWKKNEYENYTYKAGYMTLTYSKVSVFKCCSMLNLFWTHDTPQVIVRQLSFFNRKCGPANHTLCEK